MEFVIPADFMTMGSLAVGVAGFVLAIWQAMRTKRTREIYRLLCQSRCKSIVESVRLLSGPVVRLCDLKDENIDALITDSITVKEKVAILRQISDQIHAIHVSRRS